MENNLKIMKENIFINEVSPKITKAEAKIEIEYITCFGSAFALCQNGDQVFLNKRLVNKMELKTDDVCNALLLKNYEDKVDTTPWRAVRVLMAA